jgi:hypothetical protein
VSAEDFVRALDLPVTLVDSDIVPGPAGTFDIQSRGALGAMHATQFDPDGDTARIVGIVGWIGDGEPELPIDQHVEVLRELGFTRMVLPSGKQYELSG